MIGELLMILSLGLLAALAWYPCCCRGAICEYCTDDSETVVVTIDGFTDDFCNVCDTAWNGSYITDRDNDEPCAWGYISPSENKECQAGWCNGDRKSVV